MNSYIKHIIEAFDFDTVNKQKKLINGTEIVNHVIKCINNHINVTYDKYVMLVTYTGIYKPKDKMELYQIIRYFINLYGNKCNFNWIDTSGITDMNSLFKESEFNGDISKWDVSNVKNMSFMFEDSKFNGDISKWDVSNVCEMKGIFIRSVFNGDIS
jgi:surface protein